MTTPLVHIQDKIATITFNRPKSLNAITPEDYDLFASALREIDKRDDVLVTIWQATGRWFCAGTDVKQRPKIENGETVRSQFLQVVSRTTTDCGQALYSHKKILVAALNGPVMGISAALLGYFDFVYSVPQAWLCVPFTFLGIVAEGGASVTFARKMGQGKANEMLLWGKKKGAQELADCGFVNQIFHSSSTEQFHQDVRTHVLAELEGLDPTSVLVMKKLIKAGMADQNDPDAVNLRESYAQAERFASGIPAMQFGRISRREIKHKL